MSELILFNEESTEIQQRIDAEEQRVSIWYRAYTLWLETFTSPATKRAYKKAIADLTETMARLQGQADAWPLLQDSPPAMLAYLRPWELGSVQMQEWKADMLQRELKPRSVANRLACASSFFSFCTRYTVMDNGVERPLQRDGFNPLKSVASPQYSPYGASIYMDGTQLHRFFDAIMSTAERDKLIKTGTGPVRQVARLRDYVLFMTYICTGRRNSEIRTLRKGDIDQRGNTILYHWAGKRKERWDELPGDIFGLICAYLNVAGKPFDSLAEEDYLFARVDRPTAEAPLSSSKVLQKMKRYAKQAGLDAEKINVHTLRHSAAVAYKDQGGLDLFELSKFLGHSNIAVTQIYIDHMAHFENVGWKKVSSRLGFQLNLDLKGDQDE